MPPPHHTSTNAAATQVVEIVAEATRTMDKNGVAIPYDENDAPTMLFEASNSFTFGNSSITCILFFNVSKYNTWFKVLYAPLLNTR